MNALEYRYKFGLFFLRRQSADYCRSGIILKYESNKKL